MPVVGANVTGGRQFTIGLEANDIGNAHSRVKLSAEGVCRLFAGHHGEWPTGPAWGR